MVDLKWKGIYIMTKKKNPAVMIPRLKNKKEILGRKYEDVLC
jgi:hypothetical protein